MENNFNSDNSPSYSNNDGSDVIPFVESSEALLPESNNTIQNRNEQTYPPEGNVNYQPDSNDMARGDISNPRKYASVAVLFLINLLNYMDRFTVAGVLLSIQEHFNINNASAGLLQTVFIISYMVVAPIFGYLGDRYNRKILMLAGMMIWSGCTLLASFIEDPSHFYIFLGLRGLVGIGEASYSTIAPTIIADLFVKTQRTRMLSVFFFAIPVGSGLGYIVGSAAASAGGSWQWALRVTPGLGLITMILMMIVIPNPKRGASEASETVVTVKGLDRSRSSYLNDLKYILKNRTFMCVTIGFTFMAFVVGSLTIWGPVFVAYSQIVVGVLDPCTDDKCEYSSVSFVFGLITCIAGFFGVWIGAESAKKWKDCGNKNADAHVCAIGLIVAAPLLLVGFQMAIPNVTVAWIFIFFADLALCLTWTLVGDMTLYVTMPNRRSTAQAVQILTMHLLGDAGSPYLLGVMSDSLTANMPDTYYSKYIGLQRSMYITLFASVLGGGGFLMASVFLKYDKKRVDDALLGEGRSATSSNASSGATSSTSESSGSVELSRVQTSEAVKPLLGSDEQSYTCNAEYRLNCDSEDLLEQGDRQLPNNRTDMTSHSPEYISIIQGSYVSSANANFPAGKKEAPKSLKPHLNDVEKADSDCSDVSTDCLLAKLAKESDC